MTPALRALRLLAAIVTLCAVVLLANRWHASRALDSARARNEALGLRLDLSILAREPASEARAALRSADETCNAIGALAVERHSAEGAAGPGSEDRLDELGWDEAYRAASALEAAATAFLASTVPGTFFQKVENGAWHRIPPRPAALATLLV